VLRGIRIDAGEKGLVAGLDTKEIPSPTSILALEHQNPRKGLRVVAADRHLRRSASATRKMELRQGVINGDVFVTEQRLDVQGSHLLIQEEPDNIVIEQPFPVLDGVMRCLIGSSWGNPTNRRKSRLS
jgi:hypothetical protein